MSFFEGIAPLRYEGPDSTNPLAFRHYDPDATVMGKRMEDHLRFAVAYWHSFAWEGGDPFGGPTFERPWHPQDRLATARIKADAAFEMFDILGQPFFCWHDADIRPEGATFADSLSAFNAMIDCFEDKMASRKVRLLWGTANMFSHRRWMSGAATNPDPDVFAYAAATVKTCMDATHRLGGQNYVLWGGREGYETLLNTDLARELDHMGRFLSMVVEYKHKIGFQGTILLEPKPQEPSKHQYDFDVATCYGFLRKYGLENEVKLNIEQGHAIDAKLRRQSRASASIPAQSRAEAATMSLGATQLPAPAQSTLGRAAGSRAARWRRPRWARPGDSRPRLGRSDLRAGARRWI
jgi:xylose isomerase